jgi:AcrR family transcriptional regulator
MAGPGLSTAAVVDAAAALVDSQGFHSLTLARLAERLGVRVPSLYSHVDGLEDLRRRVGARGAGELAQALSRAAAGRAGSDALSSVAQAYRDYALTHPGCYAASQRSGELSSSEEGATASAAAVEVVLAVLRGYRLEGEDALHATRTIRAALHGFVLLEAADGFALDLGPDESFRRLIATLDRGLRAREQ